MTKSSLKISMLLVGLSAILPLTGSLRADDDEIVVLPAAGNPAERDEVNINFDQQVFVGLPNAAAGRQRLEIQIKLQLAEIDRACQLTEAQKDRLALAARGDLHRFMEQVESVRRKFDAVKHDQEKLGQIWQDLQPLQNRQARGLTGQDTLLAKVVGKTLTDGQAKDFDTAQTERRKFRYEAAIGVALHSLEAWVALTKEQRQKLTKLLLDLPPPRVFGQYDHFLVNYRLSKLPAAKLQPIFDARQWKALQQQLAQAPNMRQHLIEQGYLSGDDFDVTAPEERP